MHELEIVLKDCLISMRACQTALNWEGKAILEQPGSEAVRSVLSLWISYVGFCPMALKFQPDLSLMIVIIQTLK